MRKFKKYFPTNKWWAQFVASCATLVTMAWTGDGINTDDEKKAVVGIVAALALTYITKNSDTPGGLKG